MALFEIVDEITRKQFEKTETGDNRMQGVVVGQVSKNYDKDMPGRVCVQIVSRDTQANELLWARVAMPSSGEKWGHYFLPEVGDEVLVAFEQGNIERPYIIGCIPKLSDQFLKKSVDEKNQIKLAGHWCGDLGYPASTQLPDGSIITVYYQADEMGEPPSLMATKWRLLK